MPTDSPTQDKGKAYVRVAHPSELKEISLLHERAFAKDAILAWIGSYPAPLAEQPPQIRKRKARGLRLFYYSSAKSIALVKGRIVVVVEPTLASDGATKTERIVAAALWRTGRQPIGGLWTTLRAGGHKCMLAWGWKALVVSF